MIDNPSIFKSAGGEAAYRAAYARTLKQWPIPFEEHDIPISYGSIHLIASGPEEMPPLIFLHMASISAAMWYPNVAAFSDRFRIYAIDTLNDTGLSKPAHHTGSRKASANWLLEVFDALQIDQANVIGASYGGWLALNLAIHAPERVRKFALVAPAGAFKPLRLRFFTTIGPLLFSQTPEKVKSAAAIFATEGFDLPEELMDQFYTGLKHLRLTVLMGLAIPGIFSDAWLRRVAVPCLLLYGDSEVICDPEKALERARKFIPDVETHLLPGVGHGLSMEQPDTVNALLLKFLLS